MEFSLQRALLLVLGGLVPVVAYAVARADLLVAVAAVNVLLIFVSLRIATGGRIRPGDDTRRGETHESH
ncbi:MAG: hypothetical protein PPP55_06315 [Halorubrum sp.]